MYAGEISNRITQFGYTEITIRFEDTEGVMDPQFLTFRWSKSTVLDSEIQSVKAQAASKLTKKWEDKQAELVATEEKQKQKDKQAADQEAYNKEKDAALSSAKEEVVPWLEKEVLNLNAKLQDQIDSSFLKVEHKKLLKQQLYVYWSL